MSPNSSKSKPRPEVPESMLYGDPEAYLKSLEPAYRKVVCTLMLRYLGSLREAFHADGTMLMSLAVIESRVSGVVSQLLSQAPVTSQFIAPPQE